MHRNNARSTSLILSHEKSSSQHLDIETEAPLPSYQDSRTHCQQVYTSVLLLTTRLLIIVHVSRGKCHVSRLGRQPFTSGGSRLRAFSL